MVAWEPGQIAVARPWEPHKYASQEYQESNFEFLLDWIRQYYNRIDDMSLAAHKQLFDQYAGSKYWLTEMSNPDHSPKTVATY